MAKKAAGDTGKDEEEDAGKTKGSSEKMGQAVKAAIKAADGRSDALKGVNFGSNSKGYAYDTLVGPTLRELCKSNRGVCGPRHFPEIRQKLEDWETNDPFESFAREILLIGCDTMTDRMAAAGAEELEDALLLKTPNPQTAP